MIYGHEPILNDDFKHSTPKEIIIGDRILKELDCLILNYEVNGTEEDKQWLNNRYNTLDWFLKVLKKSLQEYKEAVDKSFNKSVIDERKRIVREKREKLIEIKELLLKELDGFSRNP
ncbi:hypothetical protein [Planococcus sp. ISL-109]|uniref:hypothetical protein n=1 Tax=Planococcus sp. ISL-109 TaxID=2819166 RepID=UPI001BEC569A|nr:hypothetical protein [Planococcus sp. ISL-109]MBT2583175.1 hypothetical protein [Planococcus sp. ISL-109]